MSKYQNLNLQDWERGFFELFDYSFDPALCGHDNMINASKSPNLKTQDLIEFATAVIKHERETGDEQGNKALLILQERSTDDVYYCAKELLNSDKPEERQLGATIFRESKLSQKNSSYHETILNLLYEKSQIEKDEEVLIWIVSAIGWIHTRISNEYLFVFTEHPLAGVRFAVAANWIRSCSADEPFPSEVANVAEKLCKDNNSDVRWYSYSNLVDISEEWGIDSCNTESIFNRLLCEGLSDEDSGVVQQAKLAIAHQKNKNLWSGNCNYDLMSYEDYLEQKNITFEKKSIDLEIAEAFYEK